MLTAPFLTDIDPQAAIEGSRDPLGLQTIWARLGQLVQLDDALRTVPDGVTVYYDQNGLVPDAGSSRLDVKRIAVRHGRAIFHPKNVFALVEDLEPDEDGHRARALIVACLSANLTRAGCWENVEVCHTDVSPFVARRLIATRGTVSGRLLE